MRLVPSWGSTPFSRLRRSSAVLLLDILVSGHATTIPITRGTHFLSGVHAAAFDSGGRLSARVEGLTTDLYHWLVPLRRTGVHDYTRGGGCAIGDLYGMRGFMQVKSAVDGRSVFIQAPAVDDRGQCDPSCHVVWLSDDEIPTIIRALQARRRAVLGGSDAGETPSERGE